MRALLRDQWVDGLLDFHRGPDEYRLRVHALSNLETISGLYFVRPFRARLIWNYVSQVGPVMVWRKIASRLQERSRNEKCVSIGVGSVVEKPTGGALGVGQLVAFIAPSHPRCVERIVLPADVIVALDGSATLALQDDVLLHLDSTERANREPAWWHPLRGWSVHSGSPLPPSVTEALPKTLIHDVQATNWSEANALPVDPTSFVAETRNRRAGIHSSAKKRAVLFGYGHYAKTNILPDVSDFLDIVAAHEIDPTQIPIDGGGIERWDTSAELREGERYDVFLIAGFHHSHAPLAVAALESGAYAVVEKPIAVDREQLDSLYQALERSDRGVFACFHKRYSPLNQLALQDLGQRPGAPIDYHCIVYEVPLPDLHWYRWPNSKSRLISNGCHWIDHFLYLNGFCEVESTQLIVNPRQTINCSVVLRNGALFTMVLTELGSDRIGLQDHVELRAGGVTVTIANNADYTAEKHQRVVRRARVNKTRAYQVMYREIANHIAHDEGGDSLHSVRVSTGLVLDLEAKLAEQTGATVPEATRGVTMLSAAGA